MNDEINKLLWQRLQESTDSLKKQFNTSHSVKVARHFVLDNLLPNTIAEEIYASFPPLKKMRTLKNAGELKMKYSHIKNTARLIQDVHEAIQHPTTVALIEEITGIKRQIPDQTHYSGGVSAMLKGGYINPHLDNSHDTDKKYYRTVNLLYYVSPNWREENGGNYELWDEATENRLVVPSLFNRLVVMETNRKSWHSVSPVKCDAPRCCVFNYYFSPQSPEGEEYFHTSKLGIFNRLFRPRPEQKFRRAVMKVRDKVAQMIG